MRVMMMMMKMFVFMVIYISCSLLEMECSNNELFLGVVGGGVLFVGVVCVDGGGGNVGIFLYVYG